MRTSFDACQLHYIGLQFEEKAFSFKALVRLRLESTTYA